MPTRNTMRDFVNEYRYFGFSIQKVSLFPKTLCYSNLNDHVYCGGVEQSATLDKMKNLCVKRKPFNAITGIII